MVNAIFCAHGKLACAMLESVQMVYGNANVEAVEFVPGENAGDIVAKLEKLVSIHNQDEWLIAVDLQCGSPWNAAAMLAIRNPRLRVISGLSLPLALELVDNQDSMNVDELCEHLTQIAKQTCVVCNGRGGFLMNITLARIDDRLIHGQVTTVWSKVANAQRIIICNDEVYNDEVRRTLLRQAAPPGMKVNVVNIEKAVAVYHNPQYQDETVFYLFTRPQDALAMVRQGVKIDTLNIGGMAWRPGKKQLTKAVSLDDDDINAFHELNNLGVILDLRVVASDPSINIIDKINEQLIAN